MGDGVPLGFDLLHFGYQTALQEQGRPPAAAAAAALLGVLGHRLAGGGR